MTIVRLSRAADADLEAILAYSVATHGREIAEAYLNDIDRAFERLCELPKWVNRDPS